MTVHQVCVLGGTGFIGREVVARLGALGHEVKVLTRNPAQHRELIVLPSVRLVRANVHDEATLAREFRGCDVVVNLVGILNERALGRGNGAEFRRVHTELPQKAVRACRQSGVRRYLHMSGLKADSKRGPSHYLRSKGAAEDYIREHCADGAPDYVIFKPSVVFGPGDAFINNFATILSSRRACCRSRARRRSSRRSTSVTSRRRSSSASTAATSSAAPTNCAARRC